MFTNEQIETFTKVIAYYSLGNVDCTNNSEDEAFLEAYNAGLSIEYEAKGIRHRSLTGEFYNPAYVVKETVGFEDGDCDLIEIHTCLSFLDALVMLVSRSREREIRTQIYEMDIHECYPPLKNLEESQNV